MFLGATCMGGFIEAAITNTYNNTRKEIMRALLILANNKGNLPLRSWYAHY